MIILPDKISIFIDGSNFYHRLRAMGIKHIDLPRLLKLISKDRPIANIYYCDAPFRVRNDGINDEHDKKKCWHQAGWFNTVKKIPNVNFKLYNRDVDAKVKGDDIHLAVEMVKEAYENTYDVAILVSGDGDFQRALQVVIGRGKKVENVYFSKSRSPHLNFVKGTEIDDYIFQCTLSIY